ncbi:MAG TPA: trehalose-6-phosphate synthase [Acetobacteraceae bacterium]|nr:trehalose-6-phosphate synthase [Acetobacteraceae bacterium]
MSRLVVVSNRVPVPTEKGPQAGGLAVALGEALAPGSLWFGWSGRRAPRPSDEPTVLVAGGITYATLDLSETEYQRFYAGYSNSVLWPLLHFRLGLLRYTAEEYQGYRAVNRRFAATLARLLRPGDLIWVHDYHLIPLGTELRALGVKNRLGFFLHTPFVPPSILQTLPRDAEALLASLCAYDVVGFHTREYKTAFEDCAREMLGAQIDKAGRVWFGTGAVLPIVDPIGIDPDAFARMAVAAERGSETQRLRQSLAGRALAIGVDRLDYSKGLPNRLEAFGRMLAQHPEHRRQVSLLQIAARSREDVTDYRDLGEELNRIVGDVDGEYSEFDWVPIRYMTRAVRRRTLAGFYRIARVGLVTPLRDGMNLVAKEFVAAQDPLDPGVLVLSRFAGAAAEMTDALLVNPYDVDEIADATHRALVMGLDERRERHRMLRQAVWHSTARRYCETFLAHLEGLDPPRPVPAPPLPILAGSLDRLGRTP